MSRSGCRSSEVHWIVGLVVALGAVASAVAGEGVAAGHLSEADQRFLTDYAQTLGWRLGRPNRILLTPDGTSVLFLRSPARGAAQRLYALDTRRAETRELVTPEQLLDGRSETMSAEERDRRERMRVVGRGITSYQLSRDGRRVLVEFSGRAYVKALGGDGVPRLIGGRGDAGGPALFDARFSPDGQYVSFVRGGELWLAPTSGGKARKLTSGALASGLVTNAQAEFVAQEELHRFTGYWWSPDARHLVYEHMDARGVEQLYFADPMNNGTPVMPSAYPRPGQPNAKCSFGIVARSGGPTRWIKLDPRFEYVAQVSWEPGAPLTMVLLTRDQKELSLVEVDPATGTTRELLHEHDDAWVPEPTTYRWLDDGSGFLWSSDRSGALQLERYDRQGRRLGILTTPELGFQRLLHVDAQRRVAIVTAAPEPVDAQLWEVPLDGGQARPLTVGPQNHSAVYASKSMAHILSTTDLDRPEQQEVFRADGTSAGLLPSVVVPAEPGPLQVTIRKLGPAPGFWTALVRPHQFDAQKKYPVILSVYGGPGDRVVRKSMETYRFEQWIADHGYLVALIDNRGTPGRGRDWERAIYGRFAEVPLADQVTALQALAAVEPAMDMTRVGITGASFGGFMAALAVMRRPDVFKAGVAISAVTDWRNYDTCYTERYLGVPPPAGASDVYERNGLMPYAKDLVRPLLLMHGTADDNVHFSETLHLADALFRAGRRFELQPIARQTHLTRDAELFMRERERVFAFFEKNL